MRATISDRDPLLVSAAEAAYLLGVKPWPVVQLCQAGELR